MGVDLSDYFLLVFIMSMAVALSVWLVMSDLSGHGLRQTLRDLWQTYFAPSSDLPSDPSLNPKIELDPKTPPPSSPPNERDDR